MNSTTSKHIALGNPIDITDTEIWRDIANYEGLYQISNTGKVRSLKFGKILYIKPTPNSKNYLTVSLYKAGHKGKRITLHRLVAQAFLSDVEVGEKEDKPFVDHIDNDRLNKDGSNSSSFVGVYWNKGAQKFRASIRVAGGKRLYLGCFDDDADAALAYDAALIDVLSLQPVNTIAYLSRYVSYP